MYFREGDVPAQSVLIIDDEVAIRTGVRLTLEDVGYEVIEAPNGRVGLDILQTATDPLVVLLDLMMPEMSGIMLLQALKDEPALAQRHAFVIFTAARAFSAPTLVFYLPGKRLLNLPKPFSLDELLVTVEQAAHEIDSESAVS
jgi:CheY-like chemotaxis protein